MSSEAWWQRPVWPTTRPVTWAERGGRVRSVVTRARRMLTRPWALAVVGALGVAALAAAVWLSATSAWHPAWLWGAGSLVVAGSVRGLLPRTRVAAWSSPNRASVVALAVAALLVGMPYGLATATGAGAYRVLGAVLPADVDSAVQVGEHVALSGADGTLTFLDLATGTARPVELDGPVRGSNPVPDGLLVVTDTGATLLAEDGTLLWRHPGTGLAAPIGVAAAGDVVVLAQRPARAGAAPVPAVALRRDGSRAWTLDGATSPFVVSTAGGVAELGAALPAVALLDVDGTTSAYDPVTGRRVDGPANAAPVAAIGNLAVWQRDAAGVPAAAGPLSESEATEPCTLLATGEGAPAWQSTAPCVRYVEATHGSTAVYLSAARNDALRGGTEHVLDLTSGATRESAGWSLAAASGLEVGFDAPENSLAGRVVARDTSGAVRWALPAGGRPLDAPWASSTDDALVLTSRPLGLDPLASWRTPQQVSLVDLATGTTTAWVRCTSSGVGNLALSGGRGLALCARPDGTARATVLSAKG